MNIPYESTNFPRGSPANLIGKKTLNATWTDIVWSAVTVGKPGASHLLSHRWHSLADVVVRSHSIYANLRQLGHRIGRSSLYETLDPTEKGATSYFLGMVVAKLFAAELFDTPWLFHVSQATLGGAAIRFKRGSNSRPDLIGQNSDGEWLVFEAKGRTNGLDTAALSKAKVQTSMIKTINGVSPVLRVALQAYFDNQLRVRIDDPSDAKPDSIDVELQLDTAFSNYYSLASAIEARTSTRETVAGREFVLRADEDSGVTLGIQASILESVRAGEFKGIREDGRRVRRRIVHNEDSVIYPDGIFVRLDARWSTNWMSLEPEARIG